MFGAPGCRGAGRPEKRVTARSKLPQKKCTGLTLPMKRARNALSTRSAWRSTRQKRCAYAAVTRCQRRHQLVVKVGHRARHKGEPADHALARLDAEHVVVEVELELERPTLDGDGRRREPARGDVERHLPP